MTDLYRKHRPTSFDQVRGQDAAVKVLQTKLKSKDVPHALLFSGPSGSGKTTLARILAAKLGCVDGDFQEVNCASVESAIASIREIQTQMFLSPGFGSVRVWLLDEVQSFSRAKFAQEAMLKMLEECPNHVYFMLATTAQSKLIGTVLSRCTVVPTRKLCDDDVEQEVKQIAAAEEIEVSEELLDLIVSKSQGNMRAAINCLQKTAGLSEKEAAASIKEEFADEADAFAIVKTLLWERKNKQDKWDRIVETINGLGEQNWEGLRQLVLKVASGQMLKNFKVAAAAYRVQVCFRDNWYDCGRSGLLTACWEAVFGD